MTQRVTISLGDQQSADAYLATTTTKNTGAGVVIVHEIEGLTDHFASLCDRLAECGYSAIAPNMFAGDRGIVEDAAAGNYPSALSRIFDLGPDKLVSGLNSAREALVSLAGVDPQRVAVVGFCFGGYLALLAATDPYGGWAAAAPFYGPPAGYGTLGAPPEPSPLTRAANLSCPAKLFYGSQDTLIPAEDAVAFVTKAQAAGAKADLVLENAGHAFFNDARDTYHEDAATHAWRELLAFFDATLRETP
ncbi:dienelactone hydrolase family protein [Mycobacterium sp. CBMA271]|uniref:dienelactone hydrolase family protein n=1 Tax=unclassified Mycobacteroides TaxID=2618759 RepID=UPI0012DFAA1A|nr:MULTISPECIES: dienelactone hydrolase family protein [unclassified Mycobacteroides]MUM18855.1 hypothetical protein [Mycobacteroides sp. CBMA 326]MUM23205.1 dienelactone hydrolase family protein [Mycobacteroides sp. CBMA 271]